MFEKRNALGPKAESNAKAAAHRPSSSAAKGSRSSPGHTALVGAQITITGDITGKEDLIIEGQVKGAIVLPNHVVSVGQSGTVNADITASKVFIDGRVQGDIVGMEQVALTANGWVRGNITAPRVKLEDGAKFKGSIDMDPTDAATHQAATPQAKASPTSGRQSPKAASGQLPTAQGGAVANAPGSPPRTKKGGGA